MPTFRGRPACKCLVQWLPAYEAYLIATGNLKTSLDIYQLNGTYVLSAGTHAGGAADLGQDNTTQLRAARNMGAAAHARGPANGFPQAHSHLVLKGCPHLAPQAAAQVRATDQGRDALARNGPDTGPRAGVQWPIRTWRQGIRWATQQTEDQRMNQTQNQKLTEIWESTRPGHKGVHHQGLILAEIAKLAKRLDTIERKLTK